MFRVVGGLALCIALVAVSPGTAQAGPDQVVQNDKKGDATSYLDVRKVTVTSSKSFVTVVVKLTDVKTNPAKKLSATTVHFDTGGSTKPNHLMSIAGFHWYTGSTSTWDTLRRNKYGNPFGDWTGCQNRSKLKRLYFRPGSNEVVFRADRSCLRNPNKVRVAVETLRPYGSKSKRDFMIKKHAYTKWLKLS